MIEKGDAHYLWELLKAASIPSINKFERAIGVSSTINKIISEGRMPQYGTIEKILKKFPNINREWLETGKGIMLINPNLKPADEPKELERGSYQPMYDWTEKKPKSEVIALGKKVPMRLREEEFADAFPDWEGLPVYNVPVSGGLIKHYQDESSGYSPLYHLRDPQFHDCDFAARISGDSMHSEIRHGDYVICKEVTDISFIAYGDIYYISAKNGIETVKYVHPIWLDKESGIEDPEKIMLVPRNESVPRSPIMKEMIQRMYKVRGIIRGY